MGYLDQVCAGDHRRVAALAKMATIQMAKSSRAILDPRRKILEMIVDQIGIGFAPSFETQTCQRETNRAVEMRISPRDSCVARLLTRRGVRQSWAIGS